MTKENQTFMHNENRDSSPFGEPLNFFDVSAKAILDGVNATKWESIIQAANKAKADAIINQWPNADLLCIEQREYLRNLLLNSAFYDTFGHDRNFEIQNGISYRAYLMQELKKAVDEHIDSLEPKTKKKAEYKNKTYKNTAKQAKPSPILMSLINRKP